MAGYEHWELFSASEAKQNVYAYQLMTLWLMHYSSAVYKPLLHQHSLLQIANSIFLHVSIACSLTRSSEFCWLLIWCVKYCNDDTSTDENDSRVTLVDEIVDAEPDLICSMLVDSLQSGSIATDVVVVKEFIPLDSVSFSCSLSKIFTRECVYI